jgi:hypothetical protein
MLVTRRSPFTGKALTLDLPISTSQAEAYSAGALVQDAFPHLDADQREFLITGIAPGEWDAALGPEEG